MKKKNNNKVRVIKYRIVGRIQVLKYKEGLSFSESKILPLQISTI